MDDYVAYNYRYVIFGTDFDPEDYDDGWGNQYDPDSFYPPRYDTREEDRGER